MGLLEWFKGGEGEKKSSPLPKVAEGKPKEELLRLTLAEERLISFFRKRDYAGILNLISHFKPTTKQNTESKDIKSNPANKHTVSREKIIILELMLERLSSIAQKAKTLKDIADDLNKISGTLKEINDTK